MATSYSSEQTNGSAKGRPRGVMLPGLAAAILQSNRKRAEIARKVGISRPYLWKLENQVHGTTDETVEILAKELGTEPAALTSLPA